MRELPARTSSWGCAREGGVGTEVREVGSVRQSSPKIGVVGIDVFHMGRSPRGPSEIGAVISEYTPKKIPIGTRDLTLPSRGTVMGEYTPP